MKNVFVALLFCLLVAGCQEDKVVTKDFDEDGDDDIVVIEHRDGLGRRKIIYYENDGSGHFRKVKK